jgi:t-SNARE complex subunit (syntaxin)
VSEEKIINTEEEIINISNNPEEKKKLLTGRVDINHLLARARKEQEKNNFTNLVFFGLFVAIITIVIIIFSLSA